MAGRPYPEDGWERGLSWSDCAVLLRSVRHCRRRSWRRLRKRGIPFVVSRHDRTVRPAKSAGRPSHLPLHGQRDRRRGMKAAWFLAGVGLRKHDLQRGVALLEELRKFAPESGSRAYNLQRTYLELPRGRRTPRRVACRTGVARWSSTTSASSARSSPTSRRSTSSPSPARSTSRSPTSCIPAPRTPTPRAGRTTPMRTPTPCGS